MARILVTGGTGFIATHCLLRLLAEGHEVRTTIRDPARGADLRRLLAGAGAGEAAAALTILPADLLADAGWDEAARGCDYVLHMASPFPSRPPRDAAALIAPAREGTVRVLRAAQKAGVRRVVVTSSFAAVGYGHASRAAPFTEADWTNTDAPGVQAYARSKTLAERAAWDFIRQEGAGMELAVVNPVAVFGPVIGPHFASSILLLKRLLDGSIPGSPDISLGVVDVRDVVDLHLSAMLEPAAAGERFLATAGPFISISEIAALLRARLGTAGAKVPSRRLPNWLLRGVSLFDRQVASVVPELGVRRDALSDKARQRLGWAPRGVEEALLASAESLIRLGLV